MRARLRAIFGSLENHTLEWAVTVAVTAVLPSVLALEEQIVAWFPPTWWYRAFLALIVVLWWLWIRWEWHRPRLRFDPESGAYIDIKTGNHYCTQCRKEGHKVPMRESKSGWRCFGCTAYYPKP